MHDALRQRLLRRVESLPDAQIYQVLDYIEFLESKYAEAGTVEASGLQKFAEGLEDKLRRKAVSPATIREAFQLISAADRVLSGVSSAGKQILNDLNSALEPSTDAPAVASPTRSTRGSRAAGGRDARIGGTGRGSSTGGASSGTADRTPGASSGTTERQADPSRGTTERQADPSRGTTERQTEPSAGTTERQTEPPTGTTERNAGRGSGGGPPKAEPPPGRGTGTAPVPEPETGTGRPPEDPKP